MTTNEEVARAVASKIASYYLQAGPEHNAMVLTIQGPISNTLAQREAEVRAETWKATIAVVKTFVGSCPGDTQMKLYAALEAAAKQVSGKE